MAYHVSIEQRPSYLHVMGSGSTSEENARQLLIDAYRAAVERRCDSLLLHMNFSGPPLALGRIYSVVAERSSDGSLLRRIAYVDASAAHSPDGAEFAEMVARNRGVNVRLFRSLSEAERWLEDGAGR